MKNQSLVKKNRLIREAATIDFDGEEWRDRMEAWIDLHQPKWVQNFLEPWTSTDVRRTVAEVINLKREMASPVKEGDRPKSFCIDLFEK